jgi:hypothetical protein
MTENKTRIVKKEVVLNEPPGREITDAKKPGFYLKVLKEAEALDFAKAEGQEGLDEEIALLRVKIKEVIEKRPDDIRLIMRATDMLAKMVKIKYSMSKEQKKGLGEAIKKVITEIGVPLGVSIINKKL